MKDVKIEFRKPMYPVNPELMDYLEKEDIDAKIEIGSSEFQKIKSKEGFPITVGLWNGYEINGKTLRQKAWNLK